MLDAIRIVLVETSHPGNIGATARAMKNMGLSQLTLVAPVAPFPCAEATARAAGADELLARAQVTATLTQALDDCVTVIGTSARSRRIAWPEITPRQAAEQLRDGRLPCPAAIVFGRENSGLTNDELDRCQYLLKIPCHPAFCSLNLAQAVQIVAYELFLAASETTMLPTTPSRDVPLASAAQMESFYGHLQQTLLDIRYLHPQRPTAIMRRLRRLFHRARLDVKELDILRGILTTAQGQRNRAPD